MADFPSNKLFLFISFLPKINSNSSIVIILILDMALGFFIIPEINLLFTISPTNNTLIKDSSIYIISPTTFLNSSSKTI